MWQPMRPHESKKESKPINLVSAVSKKIFSEFPLTMMIFPRFVLVLQSQGLGHPSVGHPHNHLAAA